MRAVPHVLEGAGRGRASSRWAARTRRSSRARPTSRRRPRGSCARVRLRRPEVLGQLAGLRRAAGPRRARPAARREDREDHDRRPARPRRTGSGPVIDQRAVDRHQAAVAEARRDGTVFTGGEHLTDGDLARGFYVEPTVVGNLPAIASPVPRRAVRAVHRGRRGRLARRGDRASPNDNVYGLTAGVYSEDQAEVQQLPRRRSRRASCTSTGAPARRPARGRASRRSAAGRAAARPARPALSMYYVAQFLREQSHTVVD